MRAPDRKSTRLNSSHDQTSYAVFCLKKKKADLPEGAPSLGKPLGLCNPGLDAIIANSARRSWEQHKYVSLVQQIVFFFFNDTATTEIYTLSLHDALPI